MLNELIELINPFNTRAEEHEADPVVRELSMARLSEVSQLVRSTLYADTGPVKPSINFNAPTGMNAVPVKEKQTHFPVRSMEPTRSMETSVLPTEVSEAALQPASSVMHSSDPSSQAARQAMAAQSREAMAAIYAAMPTAKPMPGADQSTTIG